MDHRAINDCSQRLTKPSFLLHTRLVDAHLEIIPEGQEGKAAMGGENLELELVLGAPLEKGARIVTGELVLEIPLVVASAVDQDVVLLAL